MRLILSIAFSLCVGFTSCRKDEINPGDDPNFTIVAHEDEGFNNFNRKVVVFGIPIYAKKRVEDDRLLHAANILALTREEHEAWALPESKEKQALLEKLSRKEKALEENLKMEEAKIEAEKGALAKSTSCSSSASDEMHMGSASPRATSIIASAHGDTSAVRVPISVLRPEQLLPQAADWSTCEEFVDRGVSIHCGVVRIQRT